MAWVNGWLDGLAGGVLWAWAKDLKLTCCFCWLWLTVLHGYLCCIVATLHMAWHGLATSVSSFASSWQDENLEPKATKLDPDATKVTLMFFLSDFHDLLKSVEIVPPSIFCNHHGDPMNTEDSVLAKCVLHVRPISLIASQTATFGTIRIRCDWHCLGSGSMSHSCSESPAA